MKKFSKAVLRTSAYPFEFIQELNKKSGDEIILTLLGDSFFVRALQLASPELLREAQRFDEFKNEPKKIAKIRQSLLKYASRISSRSTPFGLFSGLNTLQLDSNEIEAPILINNTTGHQGYFRLDMKFSALFANLLSKHPIIRNNARFYPNTTLYSLGAYYRLTTYTVGEKKRKYELISVEKDDYLVDVIESCKSGLRLNDLVENFVSQGIDKSEAEEYLRNLVDSQLLVCDLEPSTIGSEIEFQLLAKLHEYYALSQNDIERAFIAKNRAYLTSIIEKLEALNNQKSKSKNCFSELVEFIKNELPFHIDADKLDDKYMIQCNMSIDLAESSISQNQQELIDKAIYVVNHFKPKQKGSQETRLKKFKDALYKVYDGKLAPLMEALDVETGIGYGDRVRGGKIDIAPILEGIPVRYAAKETETINWNLKTSPFWLKKIQHANVNKDFEMEITDEDLNKFEPGLVDHSTTFTAKVSLLKQNEEDVIRFDYYGGSSAASMLGRFCNGNASINELTKEITAYESDQRPEAITAEINHLPESRSGNVMHRPDLRNYKINYLAGYNDINDPTQISIEDLMVGIEGKKVILISKKTGQEVIPYHSNAFNTNMTSNAPVFQFLADIQNQNNHAGFNINLSSFHRYSNFIPRLRYQNIVLQRASWQFSYEDFKPMALLSDEELMPTFATFSKTNMFPLYLLLKQGDNELLIDTENCDSIRILLKEVKSIGRVNLVEYMLNEFESAVKNKDGQQFNNEVLISYKMPQISKARKFDYSKAISNEVTDLFLPGSEWIYYKVYLGVKISDKLLMELEAIVAELKRTKKLEKWFFIRYYDQGEHLRIRFKSTNELAIGQILTTMNRYFKNFNSQYKIMNIQMDSYQRELSRYGYEEIENFEKIFQYDSEMCLKLIAHFNAYDSDDIRWLASMYSISTYCDMFGLELDEKINFSDQIANRFRKEFGANSDTTKSLNGKFNDHKKLINTFFLANNRDDLFQFSKIIDERNKLCQPIINGIIKRNELAKNDFLSSLIHMNTNRLFRSNQRMYEFVNYDFLRRINTTMKYMKKKIAH